MAALIITPVPHHSISDWSLSTATSSNFTTQRAAGLAGPSEACIRYWFVTYTLIGGTLCTLGLLGNAMSFAVFCVDRQKTSTSFLFQCLAIVDSLLLLTIIPLYVLPYFAVYTNRLKFYMQFVFAYVQVYLLPCTFMVQTATIWLTVVVGVNRYVAVCHPYQATRLCSIRQARRQVLIVMICSIAYCIPKFFVGSIIKLPITSPILSPSNPDLASFMLPSNSSDSSAVNTTTPSSPYNITTGYHGYIDIALTTIKPWSTGGGGSVAQVRAGKTWLGDNMYFNIIYNNALYLIFLLGLPLLLLTLLNARLVRALHDLRKKRAKMQVSHSADR